MIGSIFIAVLLWFEWSTEIQQAAQATVRTADDANPQIRLPGTTLGPPMPRILVDLPPIGYFTEMIERPLFAPDRRPLQRPEQAIAPEHDERETPTQEAFEPSLEEPDFFFVGTVRRNNELSALITPFDDYVVSMIGIGENINGWTVIEIDDRLLMLQQLDHRRRLSILD